CPLIIAPAMDGGMYEHPATQANLALLAERGVTILEPEVGRFASGLSGKGRLPDTVTILGKIRQVLSAKGLLSKRKVLITAGGTREAIDPVRYISNHSSGKQGYALAQAAVDAGADVVLISTVNLPIPVGVRLIVVDSAASMLQAVLEESSNADILIMAAAVADFRSATIAEHKIKKKGEADEELVLRLTKNP